MASRTLFVGESLSVSPDLQKLNIPLSGGQIILISKLAVSLFADKTQRQVEIFRKHSPTGHKMHLRCLQEGGIHVYLKDTKEVKRQERSGTSKSFCSATQLYFQNDQVAVVRSGRLKLLPSLSSDPEFHLRNVQMMLGEVKLTQELNHPHIVSYSDFFTFDRVDKGKKIYAYSPLFEDDLFFWKNNNFPLMPEEQKQDFMLSLCDQMLQALSYLHGKGIVHNDVKHRNIYYVKKKEGGHHFALADFGMASRDLDSDFKGSLEFLPPEKAISKGFIEADYIDTGFATDLWDLGVTLYTLREGKFNFFSKLMRKQFELSGLLFAKKYAHVENANRIIDDLKNEESDDRFVELLDDWIALMKKDTAKCEETEKCIMGVMQHIKKRAAKELQRMESAPDRAEKSDPLGFILSHLLQPDPAKRVSAIKGSKIRPFH